MPNWCSNILTIEGCKEEVDNFVETAKGYGYLPENQNTKDGFTPFDFNQFIPMPPEVIENGYNGEKGMEGVESGYLWENNNWGVKWGACEPCMSRNGDTEAVYSFDTAWSPPIKMMDAFIEQYPSLTFTLQYEELGMMFEGTCIATNGSVSDECKEITVESLHEQGWHDDPEDYGDECELCEQELIANNIEEDYNE